MAKDNQENVGRIIGKILVYVILFSVLMTVLGGTFYQVDAGERAIILTFGSLSNTVYGPGLHMKIPIIQDVVKFSIRTRTLAVDNQAGNRHASEYSSLFAASKDLQDVQVATVVNYHIEEKDILQIYRQYGNMQNYETNILEPIIRDTIKTMSAQYTAEDLVKMRAEFAQKSSEMLDERFASKSALFERVNIVNFQFSKTFTEAIERKVMAEQDALAAKNKLEQVKYEAEQAIAAANGEAQAIAIKAEALKQNRDILQLNAINKWDGHLPAVTGGAVPFISLDSLTAKA